MLKAFLGGKPVRSIGLDLGSRFIKILEIEKGREEERRVLVSHLQEVPEQAIVEREILDRIGVIEALREAAAKSGIEERDVTLSISRGVILRRLKVQKGRESRDELIERATRQSIPFSLSDVIWDYLILEESEEAWDVLIVAARQDMIYSQLDLARSAGLNPIKIVPESIAWQYALQGLRKEKTALVIDVGYAFTDLFFLQRGVIVNSRDVNIGLRNFLETLRRELGFSYENGEKILLGQAEIPDVSAEEILRLEISEFLDQLDRIFGFFWPEERSKPRTFYLAGGGAQIVGLAEAIRDRFGVRTQILNPLQELVQVRSNGGPLFSLAFGLAEAGTDPAGINLLPPEERPVEAEPLYPKIALPLYTALLGILIVGVLAIRDRAKITTLRSKIAELQAEEQVLKTKESAVGEILEKEKVIRQRSAVIQQLLQTRYQYVDFLDKLSTVLPWDIWLSSVTEVMQNDQPTGNFKLDGYATSSVGVANFMKTLKASGYFSDVQLLHIKKEVVDDNPVAAFEIVVFPKRG